MPLTAGRQGTFISRSCGSTDHIHWLCTQACRPPPPALLTVLRRDCDVDPDGVAQPCPRQCLHRLRLCGAEETRATLPGTRGVRGEGRRGGREWQKVEPRTGGEQPAECKSLSRSLSLRKGTTGLRWCPLASHAGAATILANQT